MSSDSVPDSPTPSHKTVSVETTTRLNIFALPSRTTMLFALIVLVIALPIAASFGGGSPICAPFILFWMILLPFRDFLRRPTVLLREGKMAEVSPRFPTLARKWNELATQVAKIRPPRLMLTAKARAGAFTFGSLRRRYLAIPEQAATNLERNLQSPHDQDCRRAEAMLLHELAHFVHRDVWMALFSHSLLRVTIVFMLLDLVVNSLSPWLYNSLVSFFDFSRLWSPEMIQLMTLLNPQMVEVMLHPPQVPPEVWLRYEVFVLSAHWPLILGSLILLVFFWRALLRTRELYADARVVQWQQEEHPLWEQLQRTQVVERIQPARSRRLRTRIEGWIASLWNANVWGWREIRVWLDEHPSMKTRRECLRDPYKVYGSDFAIGATAGVTVVLLNLTLGSLFLSRYIRGPNSDVPFLIGFSVLSLSLLPVLCQFPERKREYSRKVTIVVLIFTAIKLVPQYIAGLGFAVALIIDPSLIDKMAYVLVPGAGVNPAPTGIPLDFVLEVFVIRPAILFTFVMPIVLILWLQLDAWLKRQVLRWYDSSFLTRHPALVLWGITALLAMLLGLILLPILDALTIPSAHDILDPFTIGGMLFAFGTLAGAMILFLVGKQRFATHCPYCRSHISGEYRLGMACSTCNHLLHPQLCS